MTKSEWDDNEFPLAYLITIRTFGTWLHGDERGSMDRHGKNIYGTERIAPNTEFKSRMRENLDDRSFFSMENSERPWRRLSDAYVNFGGYILIAINVRTNHVHIVVSAAIKPELIINAFKSNATRELRTEGLVKNETKVWSRGGSRRYLWKPHHVEAAVNYVVNGQGDDLPNF